MASSGADQFSLLLENSGVPEEGRTYLQARGIKTIGILANVASDLNSLKTYVATPFIEGIKIGAEEFQLSTVDKEIWEAAIQVAWEDAKKARGAELSPALVTGVRSEAKEGDEEKPLKTPKTLAPHVWLRQIRRWEQSFQPERAFPQDQLLGAEEVLARMLHEHTVTKQYTPLRLGEILQMRSFTSTGQINNLAVKDKDKILGISEGGQLTEKKNAIWDPKSMWSVIDGLEAAKWAYIFCEYGTEDSASTWIGYFVKTARQRPHPLPNIKSLWDVAGWRVAMSMRAGKTFEQATREVLQDTAWLQDNLSQHLPDSSPKKRPRAQYSSSTPERVPKGKGRGRPTPPMPKGKGKGKPKQHNGPAQSRELCRNYNFGSCGNPQCPRAHACAKCGKANHPAKECWAKAGQLQ